jgi:hypothetical protein
MLPRSIDTLSEALDVLDNIRAQTSLDDKDTDKFPHLIPESGFPYGIWFRGERVRPEGQKPLTPGVYRKNPVSGAVWDENSLWSQVPLRVPEIASIPNYFDRLCLMQHYGIPTRLLDWSENIMVALFFATEDAIQSREERESSLFILNARALNKVTGLTRSWQNICGPDDRGIKFRIQMIRCRHQREWFEKMERDYPDHDFENIKLKGWRDFDGPNKEVIEYLSTPVAVTPTKSNPRMVTQGSVFTFHGGKFCTDKMEQEALEKYRSKTIPEPKSLQEINENAKFKFLHEIRLSWKAKTEIRRHLSYAGIHRGSLFPELDQQIEYLKEVC